jgi:hypothetical protein
LTVINRLSNTGKTRSVSAKDDCSLYLDYAE